MFSWFESYSPFPKKVKYEKHEGNVECYFDYKRHTDIKKICRRLLEIDDKNFYDALAIFSKNHYKYRDTLYYNLQTIHVEQVHEEDTKGNYLLEDGFNDLHYDTENDIYHELLHVASSSYDKQNKLLYSGFLYMDRKGKIVGEGLTEGYVELLCGRDTGNDSLLRFLDIKTMQTDIPYLYNNILARQLEIIVGKEELEDMFFKDGFIRLKEFLMKYKSEEEVMRFFSDTDVATLASDSNSRLLNKRVLRAQEFLFSIAEVHMKDKLELLEYEKLHKSDRYGMKQLTSERLADEVVANLNKANKGK